MQIYAPKVTIKLWWVQFFCYLPTVCTHLLCELCPRQHKSLINSKSNGKKKWIKHNFSPAHKKYESKGSDYCQVRAKWAHTNNLLHEFLYFFGSKTFYELQQ